MSVVQLKTHDSVVGMKFKPADKMRTMRWHAVGGLCLINGYRKGAELGVSQGRFTMFLCAIMHDMEMIAVDLWAEQEAREGVECAETYSGWDHEGNYQRFKQNCAEYFAGRVDIRRMDSSSAAASVEDESLDFVFVDADHTYEGAKRDIEAWLPKVRIGGMLCGHDYNWPPVKKIVDEKFPERGLMSDNVWVHFRK